MAPKKRSFKDAFESAFNTILDVHEKQLNHKNHRADLKIKALEKRIHNLQEQACNDKILADAIQVHDPRQMVNLLQVIEEVIRNADFERTSTKFRKKERCDNGAGAVVTLGLNVSNVTNMCSMFCGATSFNQPLNKWNVTRRMDLISELVLPSCRGVP